MHITYFVYFSARAEHSPEWGGGKALWHFSAQYLFPGTYAFQPLSLIVVLEVDDYDM